MGTYAIVYHPGYTDETRVYVVLRVAESESAAVEAFMKECCATTPIAVGHLGAELHTIEKVIKPSFRITCNPFRIGS